MAMMDLVNTIATKKIVPGVVDLVLRNSPLLALVRKNVKPWEGHTVQENFVYGVLNAVPYSPGDTFDISQRQVATGGTVTPRYYNVAVPAYLEKLKIEMAGPQAVFDYVQLLMQVAALSMSARLANDLYRHGQNLTADRSEYLNGLEEALVDATTAGFMSQVMAAYLTVTRSNVSGALDSLRAGPAASLGVLSYDKLEEAYSSVCIGPEHPDLILTTNKGWSYVKMVAQPQQRFETTDPDFGFQSVRFNGARVIPDQYAPGTRTATASDTAVGYSAVAGGETMYFLNTDYLRFYVSPDPLFGFGFTGFMPAQTNSTVVGHYKFSGNFTCQAPRYMRAFHGITA